MSAPETERCISEEEDDTPSGEGTRAVAWPSLLSERLMGAVEDRTRGAPREPNFCEPALPMNWKADTAGDRVRFVDLRVEDVEGELGEAELKRGRWGERERRSGSFEVSAICFAREEARKR